MSDRTNEETMHLSATGTEDNPAPARKRTAKKAATKVAAKKTTAKKATAKKATVEKAAAKKAVARKAAPKAADVAQVELPLDVPPSAPRPARSASPAKAVSKPATPATPESPAASESPKTESPRRFGRVPGGGPVVARDDSEASADASQADRPPPSQIEQGGHQPQSSRDEPGTSHQRQRDGREGQDRRQPNGRQDHSERPPRQEGPPAESRSKRRREKRKRRREQQQPGSGHQRTGGGGGGGGSGSGSGGGSGSGQPSPQAAAEPMDRRPPQLTGPKVEADGILELAPKGFGFLRVPIKNFEQARDDIFVTPETIRRHHLRLGQWIKGFYQEGPRGPQLVDIESINGMSVEEAGKLPHFDELKAINPNKRISFETTPDRFTTRVVDLMAPVGRGQRGLIVSPPRSGKTTLLLHMAEAIREKYDEAIHLMVLLVDERPEEVTEFRRALPGAEIYASSNDENARNHCRIAELAIERAKRLVEAGQDVFLLMDSITRLARAYNGAMRTYGRGTGSGGITIGALEVPRRLFAAARNTRGGGSLTILATALIQTNSRADEAIFMEFKGTGNMELVLDRKIAENYIYPAVDIFKSGTRREELLLPPHMLHKIHLIRRGLAGHRPVEAMERLLFFLKKFPNNPQMLLEIKG